MKIELRVRVSRIITLAGSPTRTQSPHTVRHLVHIGAKRGSELEVSSLGGASKRYPCLGKRYPSFGHPLSTTPTSLHPHTLLTHFLHLLFFYDVCIYFHPYICIHFPVFILLYSTCVHMAASANVCEFDALVEGFHLPTSVPPSPSPSLFPSTSLIIVGGFVCLPPASSHPTQPSPTPYSPTHFPSPIPCPLFLIFFILPSTPFPYLDNSFLCLSSLLISRLNLGTFRHTHPSSSPITSPGLAPATLLCHSHTLLFRPTILPPCFAISPHLHQPYHFISAAFLFSIPCPPY